MKKHLFLFIFLFNLSHVKATALLRFKYVCSTIPVNSWYSGNIPCDSGCFGAGADRTIILQVVFSQTAPGGTIGTNPYRMKVEVFDSSSTIIGSNQIDYSTPDFSPTFYLSNIIPGTVKAKILLQKRTLWGWVNVNTSWTNILNRDACPPCGNNIIISGVYTDVLTQSTSWIKSSGLTTISSGTKVKLDANPSNNGYIELNTGFETQDNSIFIAEPLDGCGPFVPN